MSLPGVKTAAASCAVRVASGGRLSLLCCVLALMLLKLHLVRPDLIFYPVSYEVWC